MSSSSYFAAPDTFTQPPPNLYPSNSWNGYNRLHPSNQNVKNVQSNRNNVNPPLPLGPPPPLPPLPSSRPPTSNSPIVEQQSPPYYNNSPSQGGYRTRRYSNSYSGQYNSGPSQYSTSPGQYSQLPAQYSSSLGQYNNSQAPYSSLTAQYIPPGQYSPSPSQYSSNTAGAYNTQNFQRSYYSKRKVDLDSDNFKKSNKKKKKPLSQNIPQRKDWSVMDAQRALTVEKEYNKRHKSPSLIIKFPDYELNRDIVSKFHSAIDSVHFQQPSTPRFCFVTLNDSADPEAVIRDLNKIPFGQGYLTAEFKKDREDEINIGPEDIDPLTLYVGNLAQEVTKEHMVNTYPKHKRIDIGYAKKMKYTRYAFVIFKNVEDSIEAFKKTHATQMYSKSLIVRFRRLNGTVGMPGEPKPQQPQRNDSTDTYNGSHMHPNSDMTSDHNGIDSSSHCDMESESNQAPWNLVDVSQWHSKTDRFDITSIKQEPTDDSDFEDEDRKPVRSELYESPFAPGDIDYALSMHRPKILPGTKREKDFEESSLSSSVGEDNSNLSFSNKNKTSLMVEDTKIRVNTSEVRTPSVTSNGLDNEIIQPEKIKKEMESSVDTTVDKYSLFRDLIPKPITCNRYGEVKTEPKTEETKEESTLPPVTKTETLEEENERHGDFEKSVKIKAEPIDKDDEPNDGDKDDSSNDSDDFNFSNILSNMNARIKRLKKIKKNLS